MKLGLGLLMAAVLGFSISIASAQVFTESSSIANSGKLRLSPDLIFSSIDYDVKSSKDDFEISQLILGAEAQYGIYPRFDVGAHFGFSPKAELDDCNGSAIKLGFGGHFEAWRQKQSRVLLSSEFSMARQNFSCDRGEKIKTQIVDLSAAGLYNLKVHKLWDVFGGLRLLVMDKGTGEAELRPGSFVFERESPFHLVLGGSTRLLGKRIRAELLLIGETTLSFGYNFQL